MRASLAQVMRCQAYLERLPISAERRAQLQQVIAGAAPEDAMHAVHCALGDGAGSIDSPAEASLAARLALAVGVSSDASGRADNRCLSTAPPIRRTTMAPRRWPLRQSLWSRPVAEEAVTASRSRRFDGTLRRTALTLLTLGQTALATWSMTAILPYHGGRPMEIAILILFAILFL